MQHSFLNLVVSALSKVYKALCSIKVKENHHLWFNSQKRKSITSIRDCQETLWENSAGSILSTMMELAEYGEDSQALHRQFFRDCVAPSLGPYPKEGIVANPWKSFMTDDHTPVEFSWSWSDKSATPVVRYAIEPIGWAAGTDSDPFNNKATKLCLGETLANSPSLDLQWYRYFLRVLTTDKRQGLQQASENNPWSQTFIAFDLDDSSMTVKYYFLPALKAYSVGKSKLALVEDAILGLKCEGSVLLQTSLRVLTNYIRSHNEESQPQVEIFAIDCVDPNDSRLKIYIRSRKTTFDSMIDVMTLGGKTPAFSDSVVCSLAELWRQCFGVADTLEQLSMPLAETNHRTGGILYYIELRADSPYPTSKVYLPVRHYGQNDEQIALGLSNFLIKRGKQLAGGLSYYEGVRKLCRHRKLNEGLGFQTYITCSVRDERLSINAYFNPEIYHRGYGDPLSNLRN